MISRLLRVSLVLGLSVLSTSCFLKNLNAGVRFRDQIHAFNDELRWARVDLASERVATSYQAEFRARHRRWGNNLRIAETELVKIIMLFCYMRCEEDRVMIRMSESNS